MIVPVIEPPSAGGISSTIGPDVLRVEERHEVDRVGVRRQRLVLPVRQARPVDDLVEGAPGLRTIA